MITVADLRPVDLFDDLDDAELEQWVPAVAEVLDVAPGETVTEQGEVPAGVLLLLDGIVEALMIDGDREERVSRQHAPTWMGAISVLSGGPLAVRMRAETRSRIARIDPVEFRRLAFAFPAVHRRVMHQVAPVMSRVAAIEQNRERLASLGTMAAGLAHELNNPAAAARRTAAQIADAVEVLSTSLSRFVEAGVEREEAERIIALRLEAVAGAEGRTTLDALDAADAEDELADRLAQLGVAEPWAVVEPLAAAGVDDAWLERLAAAAGPATDTAVRWIAATLVVGGLTAELQESMERISSLVGAVKSYAYMDRGELVEVDVHEGLETTLAVLGHKLKHTTVEIVRDYDRELPKLTVYGSELNQVWTNLLDNAIDALGERGGTITIRTRRDGSCAEIDIADDGPGIPPEDRERLFDSFFTTKDVGQGTGLGLATARRIVVDRHSGSLTLDPDAAETTFRVRLPFAREAGPASPDATAA